MQAHGSPTSLPEEVAPRELQRVAAQPLPARLARILPHATMPGNDEVDALLENVLERAGEPLTAAAVRKALPAGRKPPVGELLRRLTALVASGRVHDWSGKSPKFSSVPARRYAVDQVLAILAQGPLTEAEIKSRVPAAAKPLVKSALAELVAAKRVWTHPKRAGKLRCALSPPDAIDYVPDEIAAVVKKLAKLGFSEAAVRVALRRYITAEETKPPPQAAELIPQTMLRLNPQAAQGALVYLASLRAALADRFPDKATFDAAVMALAGQGKVQLQSHAWPGRLSAEERHRLIEDGRGGYFDAIGLRLE